MLRPQKEGGKKKDLVFFVYLYLRNLQLLAALELDSSKWKEECMNHGRGERTDHLPIFDPTKLSQKNR